ncbi:M15 family metallopeptidase [Sporosarcina sp. YIM B06819]|uniref:M15 family metallopeptidase n=1 Tax=Sporosarcina sp. YIM B06819 TaxID=3081769 RepID=UPI00298D4C16|nr:M15 family metallopeptidase [Sporosarcina sp. YIM B06819]
MDPTNNILSDIRERVVRVEIKIVMMTEVQNRLACDIAVAPLKSLYDVATLNKAGAVARKLGIIWGGDWKNNIDRPHFEVPSNWEIPNGYKLEGQVAIPSNAKLLVQLVVADIKKEMTTDQLLGLLLVIDERMNKK